MLNIEAMVAIVHFTLEQAKRSDKKTKNGNSVTPQSTFLGNTWQTTALLAT
jgi:hypothetical protein